MNDNFYYVGIAYIVWMLIALGCKLFMKDDNELENFTNAVSRDVPKDMSGWDTNLLRSNVKNIKQALGKISGISASLFFLMWIIIGCLYAEEQKYFITILFTSTVCFLIPVIELAYKAINSDDIRESIKGSNTYLRSSQLKAVQYVEVIIKLAATALITYSHFYLVS